MFNFDSVLIVFVAPRLSNQIVFKWQKVDENSGGVRWLHVI